MQELIEILKRNDIPSEMRKELQIERTKLSLHEPDKYNNYFSKKISKEISSIRLNYFNRELQVYDVTKKLPFIQTPTLIICGRYDVQCPIMYSVELEESIPNSKLVIMEKSNHYPFLEEAQFFNREYHLFFRDLI